MAALDSLASEVHLVTAVADMGIAVRPRSTAAQEAQEAQTHAILWPEPVGLPTMQGALRQQAVQFTQPQLPHPRHRLHLHHRSPV